jgi:pimeloyl-ACP methyl ester carboxylesterase
MPAATEAVPVTEGFVDFRGMRTWYRVAGDLDADRGRVPLLALHGGPGVPSDPLEPLEALAASGRPVIRYDQLGCGRSDRPSDPSLWRIETYLDELATVRRELGLDRVHLLGWSWGGVLALEHALSGAPGLAGLVLASSPASAPLWVEEVRRLRDDLPPHVTRAMRRFEDGYRRPRPPRRAKVRQGMSTGTAELIARVSRPALAVLSSSAAARAAAAASVVPFLRRAAYEVVNTQFTKRHLMRGDPRDAPLCVFRSFAGMNRRQYEWMWGPSEWFATGPLRTWDVSDRLGSIEVPTLITSGRHDEATPAQMELLERGIEGSRRVVFEHSAHAALIEERERYRAVLEEFLDAADRSARPPALIEQA